MNFNPWHSVSYGENVPERVNAVIEIPRNSRAKYELDKETGLLKLDRVLYSSVTRRAAGSETGRAREKRAELIARNPATWYVPRRVGGGRRIQ